jgi:hypothetical protein
VHSRALVLLGMQARGHRDPRTTASPSEVNHSELSFYDDTYDIPSHFFAGEVGYMVGLRPSQGQGEARSDGGLSARRMAPKVTSAQEASRRRRMALKVIITLEVSVSSVTA